MGIIVYAFTATGKSVASKKYSNVIDMESTVYKYEEVPSEESKGTKRTLRKDWPENYFKALRDALEKYDYILVADTICDEFIKKNNLEYWRVYPNWDLKDEYIERCRARGNNETFIYYYGKYWNKWIRMYKYDLNASKIIELQSNQFIEDVLSNLKEK